MGIYANREQSRTIHVQHWLWSPAGGVPLLIKLGITPALLPPVVYVAAPATIPLLRAGV